MKIKLTDRYILASDLYQFKIGELDGTSKRAAIKYSIHATSLSSVLSIFIKRTKLNKSTTTSMKKLMDIAKKAEKDIADMAATVNQELANENVKLEIENKALKETIRKLEIKVNGG